MLFGELIDQEKRVAREEGKAEGLKEGKAEGLKEGKAEGLKEGKAEGLKEGKAEGLKEGKAEGLKEGERLERQKANAAFRTSIFSLLSELGDVPDSLKDSLEKIDDFNQFSELMALAGKVNSIKEFENALNGILTE